MIARITIAGLVAAADLGGPPGRSPPRRVVWSGHDQHEPSAAAAAVTPLDHQGDVMMALAVLDVPGRNGLPLDHLIAPCPTFTVTIAGPVSMATRPPADRTELLRATGLGG
jgi:hypothetical protein